jgi:hypothetical protein
VTVAGAVQLDPPECASSLTHSIAVGKRRLVTTAPLRRKLGLEIG